MPIKRIVHPTDFSEPSRNAFDYALEIAHRSEAELSVIHSTRNAYIYGSDEMMKELVRNPSRPDVQIETDIKIGNTVQNILDEPADLIVLGSKGKSGIEQVLFGSVTRDVILRSAVPVLIVPEKSEYADLEHITFTTDYHEGDLDALQRVAELADPFDSEITVLHVSAEQNLQSTIMFKGFRALVGEEIDYTSIDYRHLIEEDFFAGLTSYLETEKTSLVVMTRYRKPFYQNLVERGHTRKMSFLSTIPLLVLPGTGT